MRGEVVYRSGERVQCKSVSGEIQARKMCIPPAQPDSVIVSEEIRSAS